LTCTGASHAQTSVDELRKFLGDSAAITEDEFSALQSGGILVRRLAAKDKREVAVIGVLRMQAPAEIVLQAFRASMRQMNDRSLLAFRQFSNVPVLDDLQSLTLHERDVEDLKQCVVGKCQLKLSAAMIERFHKQVNWAAPDYQRRANRLFREMLLDYVRDYRERGDAALIEYHDQRRAVLVREEHRALLGQAHYINVFAPEFASYLENFPNSGLANVESSFNWTKVKFGLKPVIIVTHVATYTRSHNNDRQILTVSKQIYANHYFDSSLGVTAVVNIPATGGVSDSYLLYTNDSRADSLGGALSRVKRSLVESQAIEDLKDLLQRTQANVEVISANQSGLTPASQSEKIANGLFGGTRAYWWLLGIAVILVLLTLSRRVSRSSVARL
jgi:hypothetical protein